MLDLLLVNPNSRKRVYQSLGAELSAVEPPIWAGLMASFVRGRGRSVAVLDAEAEALDLEDVVSRVGQAKPRLVAVVVYGHQPSASTQNMTAANLVCDAIKDAHGGTPLLMVGGHVASLPERTLRECKADYACIGEGLYTLDALIDGLSGGGLEPKKIPDLVYRDGQTILRAPPAPLLQNLDKEMPGVAWDLLPMTLYRAHNWHAFGHPSRQPYAAVYTTLGCPYKCSFCCIQAPFKSGEAQLGMKAETNSYRFWSPKRVIDDLEHLVKEYGVKHVKFADEMFVLNKRHVDGVCEGVVERGLDLNVWAYARVDTVREGMLPTLKKAGVNWLAFGIEAASAKVRDDVSKGFDQEDIAATLDKVEDEGLNVIGNYIFGLPEDDLKTMQETLDMAIEHNCDFANFYCAMAYPGSALYRRALEDDWALPGTWTGYSQHSADMLPLPTRHLSAAEVIRFRDAAFETFYRNPRYLEKVRRKFGEETVRGIEAMTAHKLVRSNA